MSTPHWISFLRACVGIAGALLCAVPRSSQAISNIRREIWSYQRNVPVSPGETVVDVSFFATVGDMDRATQVMFEVVAVDDRQRNHTLLRYRWGDWYWIPNSGTRGQVFVSFALTCDGDGTVRARPLGLSFTFCSYAQADPHDGGVDDFESFTVQPGSSFGLTLVDRGGRPGASPTPLGVFECSDQAPGLSATAALEQIRRRSAARVEQNAEFQPHGSIGIYFDPNGTQCSGRLEPGEVGRVYVVAKLGGMIECGIAGAEFRFVGVPDDWIVHAAPHPDFVALGNPLDEGAALGFTCAQPQSGNVILYTVDIYPPELVEDLSFEIEARDPPSSPEAQCAHFALCDRPVFTKFCVNGQSCTVNATKENPQCETVTGVSLTTWSAVKSVFR